ncbi:MAG: hypothetical protein ABFD25_03335 [Clostridiaceae bacterium]
MANTLEALRKYKTGQSNTINTIEKLRAFKTGKPIQSEPSHKLTVQEKRLNEGSTPSYTYDQKDVAEKAKQGQKNVQEFLYEQGLKKLDNKYKGVNAIARANSPEYQADVKNLAESVGYDTAPKERNKMYNPESTKKTVPYLAEKAKMGLMDFASGLSNLNEIGKMSDTQKNLSPAQRTQVLQDKDKTEFAKAESENVSPALQTAGGVVQATTAMIPNIMLSAANPTIGLAQVGLSAAGNSAQQAMKDNATKGQAMAYGGLSGGIEAGTEKLFGALPFMKGFGDKVANKLISPIKNKLIKAGVKWAMNMGEEALEEGIAGALDPFAKRLTYDKDAKMATPAEIGEQMLMGAAVAGILGIPGTVMDATGKQAPTIQGIKNVADDSITFTMADGSTLELNPSEMDKGDLKVLDESLNNAELSEPMQKMKDVIDSELGKSVDETEAELQDAITTPRSQEEIDKTINELRDIEQAKAAQDANVQQPTQPVQPKINAESISTPVKVEAPATPSQKVSLDQYGEVEVIKDDGNIITVKNEYGKEIPMIKERFDRLKETGYKPVEGELTDDRLRKILEEDEARKEEVAAARKQPIKAEANTEQVNVPTPNKTTQNGVQEVKATTKSDTMNAIQAEKLQGLKKRIASRNGTFKEVRMNDKGELVVFYNAFGKDKAAFIAIDGRIVSASINNPERFKPVTEIPTTKAGTTMDERTPINVGDKKVKAYMFENPEVKDLYQGAAKYILNFEFVPNEKDYPATDIMKQLKADTGLQPAQIKDALERLINNHGQENAAAAKRVELVIDDMLTNGFDMSDGVHIDPNEDYLKLKSQIEGREIKPVEKVDDSDLLDAFAKQNEKRVAKAYEPNISETEKTKTAAEPVTPKTENEKEFIERYTKEILPNNVDELKKVISDLEQQIKTEKDKQKLLRINLQLFAAKEKLQALSQFRTNTLKKTVNLADDEIQKVIDEIDMMYSVKAHEETIRKAQDMVNSDMHGTIDRIKDKGLESAEDTAAAFFIEKVLKEEATKTGDYSKMKSWLKTVQVSGTKHGQTIEAFKVWQQDPDGMLKNATKTVEDVEGATKKKDPNKIKQIDDETKKVLDEIDKTDKEAADGIIDEVNKKADEIIGNKKKNVSEGKPETSNKKPDNKREESTPEDMLADKIKNYVKEAKEKKDDPVMNMVNELFRVAKESPIDRNKVQSKTALEFVAEAIKDRQKYVTTWTKAKSIVRNKLADSPEALAKLERYFDKGIRPPFSSQSFEKSIHEGMKDLNQNLGEIVKNYYAIGNKSRKDLVNYLVEKSGLEKQDAEALTKYVQNRMKELTKQKKEQILKGIFKDQAEAKPKQSALKSVEELSNVGAFVNDNYKDRVMGKLSPRLQKVINEKFKGTPIRKSGATNTDGRIDFGELVRKSTTEIDFTRVKFLKEISEKLQVNDTDARTILKAVEERFDEIVDEKRASILGNMFKKREPTVKKTGIQRVQEYINRQVELENLGAQEDAIRDFIKEKYGLPTLTNDDMAFITGHIEQLKKLEEGTRPYNETLWRIYNRIESKVPSTLVDKFRAWQRISMLPNIKTFGRNILGNVFMEKTENFNELTTESLVDWIASAFTGKRTILGPSAAMQKSIAQTKGKLEGLSDVITDIKHGVNTYDVQGQYEINVSKNAFRNPALNALEQFTNKTLQFGDRPFYEAAKARRLKELQLIKKTSEITDEMEADAVLYALDRTFQNDSKLAKGVLKIKKAIDDPVYEAIANIIVPFAKTPANILDKISDYTPIGLMKAVGHLGKTAGKGTFDQKYFSQRLGRMLTGSGLIVLGFILANKGIITGKLKKSTEKKGAFDKETGKLNYAIKTLDGYVTYDWAQPVGSLLALGADAYGQGMNKGDVMKGLEGAGNTFFNMSMLQSLNSMMSYGNPMGGFISTMLGGTQQFTPTGIKQTAKIFDKYERDTSGEGYLEEAANKFKANIPGWRESLPAKTDTFGNPVEVQEGYGPLQKIFNIAANPATVSKATMKDYEKEMDRLYNIDQNSSVLPSILERTIEYDSKDYDLNAEQYNQYKKLYGDIAVNGLRDARGNILRLGIETVIRSKEYKALPDTKKAEKISGILSKAMKSAKEKMIAELK